jgi:hypothetical protein
MISRIMVIGGVLLVVVSITADMIGLGARLGFGLRQTIGTVVGLAAIAFGYWLGFVKDKGKK